MSWPGTARAKAHFRPARELSHLRPTLFRRLPLQSNEKRPLAPQLWDARKGNRCPIIAYPHEASASTDAGYPICPGLHENAKISLTPGRGRAGGGVSRDRERV